VSTFFVLRHRDSADAYIKALLDARYAETKDIARADFILYDHEIKLAGHIQAIKDKPTFVYPHTPYSWFVWDGICPTLPASCNFVYGENAKLGLESFGYPGRVKVCGFSRCEVFPFRPSKDRRLLFAPAHLLLNKKYPRDNDYRVHQAAFAWVVRHAKYFDGVTVRIFGTIKENGFHEVEGIKFENVATATRYTSALTVESSIASIERHDIIISCNTFGYLSLARGKPTILYGNCQPRTREGEVRNYPLYKHLIDFPYPLESLSVDDVIKAGSIINSAIEKWRQKTIGGNFDAEKCLSAIKEYV
jgi:hypothetical protein